MKRTPSQNNAIHLYCRMVADMLTLNGIDVKAFPWKEGIEIEFTEAIVKDDMWKPIQKAILGKDSTTELTTAEVNEVYEVMSRHLAKTVGIDVSFPSEESQSEEQR